LTPSDTRLSNRGADAGRHTDYIGQVVNIDPGYPPTDRVHTLVHDLGHLRAEHTTRS
jgi:hypothetical protein